jgi:hypothetical protein
MRYHIPNPMLGIVTDTAEPNQVAVLVRPTLAAVLDVMPLQTPEIRRESTFLTPRRSNCLRLCHNYTCPSGGCLCLP